MNIFTKIFKSNNNNNNNSNDTSFPQVLFMGSNYRNFKINYNWRELIQGTAYSCIHFRAANIAKAKPVIYNATNLTMDNTELENHPFLDLLNNPNPYMSRNELMMTIMGNLDTRGNAYLYIASGAKYGIPKEIYVLNPDFVQILVDRNTGMITGYRYQNINSLNGSQYQNGNGNIVYSPEEIIHFKYADYINNSVYGISIVQQGLLTLALNLAQSRYQERFLQNDGSQKLVLTTDRQVLPEQQEKIRNKINEIYASPENAGRPMLLTDGLKIGNISFSPKELDYLQSLKVNTSDIFALFQVPEALMKSETVNRSTASTMLLAFYTNTLEPILNIIDDKLTQYLRNKYKNQNLYIKHKLPRVDDREQLCKELEIGIRYGAISLNEYRKVLGYSIDPNLGYYTNTRISETIPETSAPSTTDDNTINPNSDNNSEEDDATEIV